MVEELERVTANTFEGLDGVEEDCEDSATMGLQRQASAMKGARLLQQKLTASDRGCRDMDGARCQRLGWLWGSLERHDDSEVARQRFGNGARVHEWRKLDKTWGFGHGMVQGGSTKG